MVVDKRLLGTVSRSCRGLLVIVTGFLWLWGMPAALEAEAESPEATLTIKASLSATTVRLAQNLDFSVTVSWQGRPDEFDVDPPAQPVLTGLEPLATSSTTRTFDRLGVYHVEREYRYSLRATKDGQATIGSVSVPYRQKPAGDAAAEPARAMTLATSPITLTIMPALSPLRIPWGTLGGIVGLAVFISLFLIYRKRQQVATTPVEPVVEISPLDEFRQAVQAEEHRIVEGDIKEYYAILDKRFQVFLAQATGRELATVSDRGILTLIHELVPADDEIHVLEHFIQQADLVKFAGARPEDDEIHRDSRGLLRLAETIWNRSRTAATTAGTS